MKLSFVFVSNYRNITNQGFNLDGEFFFEYYFERQLLNYRRNTDYINNYYGIDRSKIDNIKIDTTALIGTNGSGKSSFLEYICSVLRQGHIFNPSADIKDDLLVFREEETLIIYFRSFEKVYNLKEPGIINLNTTQPDYVPDSPAPIFQDHLGIFYSISAYDRVTRIDVNEWKLSNVSNTQLYYESYVPVGIDHINDTNYIRYRDPSLFRYEDAERQLIFLDAHKEKLKVSFQFQLWNFFAIEISQHLTSEVKFKEIFNLLASQFPLKNDVELYRMIIGVGTVIGLIYTKFIAKSVQDENYEELFKGSTANATNMFDALRKFLEAHPYKSRGEEIITPWTGSSFRYDYYRIPEKIEFLNYIERSFIAENFNEPGNSALSNLRQFTDPNQRSFNPSTLWMNIKEGGDFCKYYKNQLEQLSPDFIEIDLGLSSGEVAMLNLFSRLYYGYTSYLKRIDKGNFRGVGVADLPPNLLIMIDEAESFLHPDWQKKYFKLLIEFIENEFINQEIQLIITSHSPFITSDIPVYDIIFLTRENGKCKVSEPQNHEKTLGGNIYRLYKDAFYLTDGFMGEFAQMKIQEVIGELSTSSQRIELDRTYIEALTNNLGEKVLRDKLNEMLDEKLNDYDPN